MQNKYTKFLIVVLALAIVVPQIAMAAWWNPFSWNWGWVNRIFHFQQTQQKQEQQADPTAGWETYTNSEYGFEIRYPKGSIIVNNPESYDQSAKIRIMMADKFSDTGSVTIKVNNGPQSECKNSEDLHPEEVKINGITFSKVSFDDAAMGGQRGFITNYYVFKNDNCYLISGMAGWHSIEFSHSATDGLEATPQELEQEGQIIRARKDFVNNVISTFKFIENAGQVGKCEKQSDCPTIYCIKAPCPQNKCINNTCMPVILLDDVYPLFLDGTLSWSSAIDKIAQVPVKNTSIKGYEIKAEGTISQNQDAGKFFTYYEKKLKDAGWVDENSFAADGIKGSQRGYKKGNDYIVMSYNITPGKIISGDNEPLHWECPCSTVYTIMSGSVIKK